MTSYGIVDTTTNKILIFTTDRGLAECNVQDGQMIVEFPNKTMDELSCKKWVDGKLVDDQEEIDFVTSIEVREKRNALLSDLDSIVSNPLRWNELTDQKKEEYSQYRESLLNVPQQAGFPHEIIWPQKPE